MPTTTAAPEKLDSLQALRAFAFFDVLLTHCLIYKLGIGAISVFFDMSGFLMIYNYFGKDLTPSISKNVKFCFKKINKLYLLHVLTFLMAIPFKVYALAGDYSLQSMSKFFIRAVLNLLLVQTYFPDDGLYYSFNGASWFLSACTLMYFVFPWILKKIKKYTSNRQAVLAMLLTFLAQISFVTIGFLIEQKRSKLGLYTPPVYSHWLGYVFPVLRLGDFFIGCNLGYIFLHRKNAGNENKAKYSIFEVIAVACTIGVACFHLRQIGPLGTDWYRYTIIYVPTSVALVYLFAVNKGIISRLATNKVLIFLGNISPYAYLFHQQLINCVHSFLCPHIPILYNKVLFVLCCFAVTLCASLVWKKLDSAIRREFRSRKAERLAVSPL